ncbi:hypothetical protein PBRA_005061 [Plasmodiophora brassicae]|uniref:Purple acid phosphatase n=1 Tax=Plasmodiophora brassicae TaxID=37360 RepID=A0A0G4IMQ6_PLABS|nr:hypothetical protein PBRA_005061 [Plasmodiophora brassicae]
MLPAMLPIALLVLLSARAGVVESVAASVQVDRTALEGASAWVTVSWDGIPGPTARDRIALYSPPDAPASIKYRNASSVATHLASGSGALPFFLINLRDRMRFRVERDGRVLAASPLLSFGSANVPMSPRLSLTDRSPAELRLSWSSKNTSDARVELRSVDRNGSLPFRWSGTATTTTYAVGDLCGPPASTTGWRDPGAIHYAILQGLSPSTTYMYRFGSATTGWSEERPLRTPPEPSPTSSVRIAVFGDMGAADPDGAASAHSEAMSARTVGVLASHLDDIDLVLHIGDLAYARGYQSIWDAFMYQISPIAGRIPYQTAVGNHELDGLIDRRTPAGRDDSGGECGVPYKKRFPTPTSSRAFWYGFRIGPVHVIVLSTEHALAPGWPQRQFLMDEIANRVDRRVTPWLVVVGHRPVYEDSTTEPDVDVKFMGSFRDDLEPLLRIARVDMAFWGHDHAYYRTCRLHRRVDRFGIGIVNATGTTLTFQFVDADDGRAVLDQVTLTKAPPAPHGTAASSSSTDPILAFFFVSVTMAGAVAGVVVALRRQRPDGAPTATALQDEAAVEQQGLIDKDRTDRFTIE